MKQPYCPREKFSDYAFNLDSAVNNVTSESNGLIIKEADNQKDCVPCMTKSYSPVRRKNKRDKIAFRIHAVGSRRRG